MLILKAGRSYPSAVACEHRDSGRPWHDAAALVDAANAVPWTLLELQSAGLPALPLATGRLPGVAETHGREW
jgi:hypothetical protein